MAEKQLGVKLTAKDMLSKSLRGVGKAVKSTGQAFTSMAVTGARALEGLTRKLFFMKEAVNVVANAVRGLWDMFIAPAIRARKLAVSLTNVFGSGTSQKIRQFSKDTGLSFETISKAALDMESKLGKAGGLDAYLKAIERVSKWRPDLGTEGAVSFVNDLVNKVTEATEGSSKQLGRYTSVVIGGTGAQMVDLSKELDKLGVVATVADESVSSLDRLAEAWRQFKDEIGGRVLDELADAASTLLEWLTKNKDEVLRLVDAFADWMNKGLQTFIDWVERGGIKDLIAQFKEWWAVIKEIWAAIEPVVGAVGKFAGQVGSGIGGSDAPASFGHAVGQTVSRPKQSYQRAVGTVGQVFGGIGGLLSGAKGAQVGQNFGERVAQGQGLGQAFGGAMRDVMVKVSVDDDGAIKAFVAKENAQRNAEIFQGAGGASNPQLAYGGPR